MLPPELLEPGQGLEQPHHPVRMQMQGLQLGPAEATAQIQEPVEIGSSPPGAGQELPAPGQQIGGRQRRAVPAR